jgi:hypothetical protein
MFKLKELVINMLMPASSDCFTHLRVLLVLLEPRHCGPV